MSEPGYVALIGGADAPELDQALARRGLRGARLSFGGRRGEQEPDGVVDVHEAVDFRRPLGVLRRIVQLHERLRFRAIVGHGEYGLLPAALAAERLGLAGPSARAVNNTREKGRMRRVLEEKGLGQVRYRECRSAAEVASFLGSVRGPIIVKPVAATGSEGVSRVDSEGEAEAAFALAASSSAASPVVLCEELVEGPEVSVEGVTVEGVYHPVAITDKRTDGHYVETGHDQPSALATAVRDEAFALASSVTAALGFRHGVSHTEVRITARGPVLIETHTRMGGDRIPVLTHRTTGVDLADVTVGLALGERPSLRPAATGRSASIRFLTGPEGRVDAVSVPGDRPPEIEEVHLAVRAGEDVSGHSPSARRLGYVLASAPGAGAAARAADDFLGRIAVTYVQPTDVEPWQSRAAS